jgi:hypothetical protein
VQRQFVCRVRVCQVLLCGGLNCWSSIVGFLRIGYTFCKERKEIGHDSGEVSDERFNEVCKLAEL